MKQKVRRFRKEEPDSPILKLFVVDANKHFVVTLHFTGLLLFNDHDTMQAVIEQEEFNGAYHSLIFLLYISFVTDWANALMISDSNCSGNVS